MEAVYGGQALYQTPLYGHYQTKLVMQTLARSLGMLSKVRHYVSKIELKNITMLYLNHIFVTAAKFGIN